MKVLIAEDDQNIRNGLVEILQQEGYTPLTAADGQEALDRFEKDQPDFLCLDIMMPGISGYDVCRSIRRRNAQVPIIFISAKSEEVDKVLGLELGADDFIMKPFGVREVIARIRAVTRRTFAVREKANVPSAFEMGNLKIMPAELRAHRGDDVIDLSLREVRLLEAFHSNPGRVLDRNTLLDLCWGEDYFPNSRTLDQHICQLRKRIEQDPKQPALIRTVHGVGYRYDLVPATPEP